MLANATLPDSVPQQKAIFTDERLFVPYVVRLAKLVGIAYLGPQETHKGTLHYFTEPITGTSIAVWDCVLSMKTLEAAAKSARVRFGVE
jgi:hypothetical protein